MGFIPIPPQFRRIRDLGLFWLLGICPLIWTSNSCGSRCVPIDADESLEEESHSSPKPACPAPPQSIRIAPGTDPRLLQAKFWLDRLPKGKADQLILNHAAITLLNEKAATVKDAYRDILKIGSSDPALEVESFASKNHDINERLAWIHDQLESGNYVESVNGSIKRATQRIHDSRYSSKFHFLIEETNLRCLPMDEGLFTQPMNPDFDRNNCGSLHPGQLIHALYQHASEAWIYVDAGHSVGWVFDAKLSEAKSIDELKTIKNREHVVITQDKTRIKLKNSHSAEPTTIALRVGSSFPLASQQDNSYLLNFPNSTGFQKVSIPLDAASLGPLALSRKNLWTLAFSQLDDPYGWGGHQGHRDCSRYLLDLMATFGIQLARHSSIQAKLGNLSLDVHALSESEKISTIRKVSESGILLLYMPGHILLYLGEYHPESSENISATNMYGISAISEIVKPCDDQHDSTLRLDRTTVTNLDLGRGSQRGSFIERITKISYYGPPLAEGTAYR